MLTSEEILKIIEAQKEVFPTKQDFEYFKEENKKDFSGLQVSVDVYAKKADKYFQEMVALTHKVDHHEKWLHQLAEKLGVKLEY